MIAASLFSILSLGIAAAVIESMPIDSPYDLPRETSGEPNLGIEGVLFQLVTSLFQLFGIDIGSAGLASGPGPGFGLLVSALRGLRPLALPLLGIGVGVTLLLIVGRRLPDASTGALRSPLQNWSLGPETTPRSSSANETWPPAEPDNEVTEAWVAMTTHFEIDDPSTRTPAEWATAAIDAGYDTTAVENLTDLFREVRYDSRTPSTDDRQQAKRDLERIERDVE